MAWQLLLLQVRRSGRRLSGTGEEVSLLNTVGDGLVVRASLMTVRVGDVARREEVEEVGVRRLSSSPSLGVARAHSISSSSL